VKQDEVVYRAAVLFLDAEQIGRALRTAASQIPNLERMRETVEQRVAEGRELEIEKKRASLNVLKARQRIENLRMDLESTETSLALLLGYDAADQVHPAEEDRPVLALPPSEDASITLAVDSSKELKILASRMAAKRLELSGFRAQRLPQLDLVAQYSLFAKYNYQDYFGQFQRHNGQLGVSVTIPILVGRSAYALAASAEADLAKLQIDFGRARSQIAADTKKAFQDLKKAALAGEVARADLDLTREQLSIYLAQYAEGRLPLAKLEETRIAESERWMTYYEAQNMMERARLAILRETGTLQAALR
ncbi:MAG: TolC family protein, partial [Bryobacteraceae bacterium]